MRNRHETDRRKAAERHAKAAAAPSIVGISNRPGGGVRGGGGGGEGGRAEGAGGEEAGRDAQETEVWVWPSSP